MGLRDPIAIKGHEYRVAGFIHRKRRTSISPAREILAAVSHLLHTGPVAEANSADLQAFASVSASSTRVISSKIYDVERSPEIWK
jgi:hypothetical protein